MLVRQCRSILLWILIVAIGLSAALGDLLRREMEGAFDLQVPLEVASGVGKRGLA